MKKLVRYIFVSASLVTLFGFSFAAVQSATLPVAGQTYTLAGSGVSSSATSFTLLSFKIVPSGHLLITADMGDIFYLTLEPGNSARQEIVSCTTVTQNSSGTATLSGCVRGLSPITPYTTSTSYQFSHGGGTQVILSNPPQFHNLYPAKANDETITGSWSVPLVPLANANPASKSYVDGIVSAGTVVNIANVVSGTAGETLVAGQVVYLRQSDTRWYKAGTTLAEASSTVLGIAQGAGSAGGAITTGVLVQGLDATQSGLTAGRNYFLSSTAGTIGTATTTRYVGRAKNATSIYFDTYSVPDARYANLTVANTFTGANTFGSTTFSGATTTMATTTINGFTPYGLIAATTSTSALTSMTIANLPPRDFYKVFIFASTTLTNNPDMGVTFNGDAGSNYSFNQTPAAAGFAPTFSTSLTPFAGSGMYNQEFFAVLEIASPSMPTALRPLINLQATVIGQRDNLMAATSTGAQYKGSRITSITLTATQANAIAIGSQIRVYAETSNP